MKAADRYFAALAGVTDPERKRKIIGELFIRIFEEVARDLGAGSDVPKTGEASTTGTGEGPRFLVQGTLYPDVIESGSDTAANIKSHHNVGGLPDDLAFDLVEPLRLLFKDEVRAVGEELGLPHEICGGSPSPARDWACASSARSHPSGRRSCATPTPWSSRRSATPASTGSCGRASPSCRPSAPSA